MRKILLIVLIFFFLLPSGTGRTQAEIRLSEVEVDLWPEFDRPSMLVIYKVTISPQTPLPVEIQLRIPAAAGAPNAVAARQPEGSLFTIPYEQELSGEWSTLSFNATTPEFQVEYYDPTLTKQDSQRHFEYRWPGDYAVDSFNIQVQQPVGAEEMRFTPSLGAGEQAGDGMVYYTQDIGALDEDQTFTIEMDYQKSDDTLSAENVPVEASGPLDNGSSGWQSIFTALPYLLGLIGLGLIVGGGLWYWRSGKRIESPGRAVPRRRKSGGVYTNEVSESAHIYCHECGKRASPGDRFCRTCGTQLRLG